MPQLVEYRFEKRARHKTKDDKYVYKVQGGKKNAPGRGIQRPVGKPGSSNRAHTAEGKHSVGEPANLLARGC
jgi:hypothetical protein